MKKNMKKNEEKRAATMIDSREKMKTKKWLICFIMLLIGNKIFAISPNIEVFTVMNLSGKNVIVRREFWKGPGSNIESDRVWHQDGFDMTLSIRDMLVLANTNVVRPDRALDIIDYYPLGPQIAEKYTRLQGLPFIDKMKAIFKTFEIVCDEGRTIITLDNLGEKNIERSFFVGGIFYTLKVFDSDLF